VKARLVTTAIVGAVVTGVAVLATLGFGGTHDGGAAPPPAAPNTAAVTRTTLVDEVDLDGTIGYGTADSLSGRAEGTVTMVAAPGAILGRGAVAFRVDNEPVIVMLGALPAYRALADGVSGPDVLEFEQNLRALGYHLIVGTDFTKATAATVKLWQKNLGLPQTGTVELGRIIYQAAPIRVAEQKQQPGDQAAPGSPVLTFTSTTRIVTAQIDNAQAAFAKVGTKVKVRVASGKSLAGTVDSAQSGGADAQNKTTIPVGVADQASIGNQGDDVTIVVVLSQKPDVLTVPIVALLAIDDGYGVQVYSNGMRRVIPVTLGLFAQGRVEVSGPGLAEDMQVVVASA
jgi:peptidoglycan hydrolase-like protein with peptidoglycan-binding domain